MKIACLAWGSLVWNPGQLQVHKPWSTDGPQLPVEFVRQSQDGRLTLVICEEGTAVTTLWSLMGSNSLDDSVKSLSEREGISEANSKKSIGVFKEGDSVTNYIEEAISMWMKAKDLDATIWTNLRPRFDGETGRVVTIDEAIDYLEKLPNNAKAKAKEYIRRTPAQVHTAYRSAFESHFGWFPL